MFEFQSGPTGLHKIENPQQLIFMVVVAFVVLIAISIGIAYLGSRA